MAGRPKKKPEYNPELQFNNFLQELRDAYEEAASLRSLADELNISLLKLRKLLITADVFTSDICTEINNLHQSGKKISEIMKLTGLSRASVHSYLPYTKGLYNASGTIVSLLRNERYCGDILSRKTFTPNYLDHKSKKNRHDRNQYRQTDHHEAIVDRDIYNAAQKMLTATKYAKKGFPFPNLKVVDGGALKGFVSVNRSWTGFTGEDYQKASQSVYSDQNDTQNIEESKEGRKEGGFDLSGYEIVRAQFFSTRLNPAMTISEGQITFNTACLKKFEDVEYIEILFNSVEKCIAVRPCNKDNINAVKWGTIRNGKWAVLPKSCRGFSEPLFELMNWNDKCKYRFRGQYSKEDNEQILLFDLEEPEVIKHEMVQEDLPDANMTETEENTVDTSENRTKKIVRTLFPKQWRNHFGCSSEDVVLLHRVKYCGNWDVLRPAKTVEGMGLISENLLEKLNNEAHSMIEKMGCAV